MDIYKLEKWYLDNHRKLPFRESKDPYQIWVSEIMLQQTQMETVLPFFERFITKYPNVKALAKSDMQDLLKEVEGLGYYRRFKNMHLAARKIVNDYQGVFPHTYDKIINLPGIGKYTAGAILSIAYHKPYSALDGNVIRVLSRYLGLDDDFRVEKNKKKLDLINQALIEKAHPNIYTQALMELGALICKPKQPDCENCPLLEHCLAYHEDRILELPFLSKLKQQKVIQYITLLIEDQGYYYLRKRDEKLLEGMYEYPQFEAISIYSVVQSLEKDNIIIDVVERVQSIKHVFTHQTWMMEVYLVRLLSKPDPNWVRLSKSKIDSVPMAIAHRKIELV